MLHLRGRNADEMKRRWNMRPRLGAAVRQQVGVLSDDGVHIVAERHVRHLGIRLVRRHDVFDAVPAEGLPPRINV